eukprot:127344-Prymnesium_polylepis.1
MILRCCGSAARSAVARRQTAREGAGRTLPAERRRRRYRQRRPAPPPPPLVGSPLDGRPLVEAAD